MALVGPKTPAHRARHENLANLHYDVEGDLSLLAENLIANGEFVEFDAEGNPVGLSVVAPEQAVGWSAYVGKTPYQMHRQNFSPFSLGRLSAVIDHPLVRGYSPPSPSLAAEAVAPLNPFLDSPLSSFVGYLGGAREVRLTWVVGGRHTTLSPAAVMTLQNGQGARVPLPQSIPEGVEGIGIWFGAVNGGLDSCRLQRVVDVTKKREPHYDLTGPYRYEKRPPKNPDGTYKNETYLGAPPGPRKGKEARKVRADRNHRRGVWRHGVVYETAFGLTPVSSFSAEFDFPSDQKSTGISVRPRTKPKGARGWHLVVRTPSATYVAYDREVPGGPEQLLKFGESFVTYGYAPGEQTTQDAQGNEIGEEGHPAWRKIRSVLAPYDFPQEDTSGLPGPDAAPEGIVAIGASLPPAGVYWGAITDVMPDGRETARSAPSKIQLRTTPTVPAPEMLRVIRRNPLNRVLNAEFTEINGVGDAYDHHVVSDGGFYDYSPGELLLQTNGAVTTATPRHRTALIRVGQQETVTFAGEVQVIPINGGLQGEAHVVVQEFDEPGIDTTKPPLRETIVKRRATQGTEAWSAVFGPGGIAWHASTISARIVHAFVGATKQIGVRVRNLAAHPGEARPRKSLRREGFAAETGVPPETPFPSWTNATVGPPPVFPGLPPDRPQNPNGTHRETFADYDGTVRTINQAHHYGAPGQKSRDDLYVQDIRIAVIPGATYAFGAWMRHRGVPNNAKPLYLTLHHSDGGVTDLGSVAGANGITGTGAWQDYKLVFTVPADCFEVRVGSRGMGQGEIVCQELALSLGTAVKRAKRYATSGTFRCILDSRAPGRRILDEPWSNWRFAGVDTRGQAGTVSVRWRSTDDEGLLSWGAWQTDFSLVPQARFLQVEVTLSGDGSVTPIVASGSPFLVYELLEDTLLEADGTELPGGVLVKGRDAPDRSPLVEVSEPQGLLDRRPYTRELARLESFAIEVFTEEAAEHLKRYGKTREFRVESRGRAFRIRPKGIAVKTDPKTAFWREGWDGGRPTVSYRDADGYRPVYGKGEVSESEIVEEVEI